MITAIKEHNFSTMLKHYLKTAWRNLRRNRIFSFINVIGLATGLSICLLIVLYVKDELSYDNYYKNAGRIYRLDADLFFNGTGFNSANSPEPLAITLKREYPQVEEIVRLKYQGNILVKKDNQNIRDDHAVFADSTIFKVFTLPMIAGNPATALNDPNDIVIDESTAKKYFGTINVIGKTLFIDNTAYYKVTGVIKDMPAQSSMHFSFIRPRNQHGADANFWLSNNIYSFILLRPDVSQTQMQKHVDATVSKYVGMQIHDIFNKSLDEMEKQGMHFIYHLMPLKDIHLYSSRADEIEAPGNIQYVYIFSVIAAFILLIACVNFINLSTARSASRAKEVGVRKVAGSTRRDLITQFLTESLLVSFISMIIAIMIAAVLLPFFNQLTQKNMHIGILFSSWMLPVVIVLILLVGCLAGSYPAFYLSSFEPVKVLKGKIAKGFKNSWLRSTLVVFQFCISVILIIGTIVIYYQLHYIQNKKIGYNRDQVLVLHNTYYLGNQTKTFRNELMKIPGVENASMTGSLPTEAVGSKNSWFKDATLDPTKGIIINNYYTDKNYIPTLGISLAEGRNFSDNFPSDSSAVIINETAAKMFGFAKPLNERLYYPTGDDSTDKLHAVAYHIVGVVKDFNFSTMHENIGPLIIQYQEVHDEIAVRIDTKSAKSIISSMQARWKNLAPEQPFNYTFMDADFDKMYHSEQQTGRLFIAFAALAILIACLGLYGLVSYAAEQRMKEIGVRKVLGASIGSIVSLLSKDFARLIFISMVIAFPIAYWSMHKWLQSFAYRISLGWWIFLTAGIIAVVIAFATISYQAIKAARMNPVKSLKTE